MLAMSCTFILADHLWSHPVFELLLVKFLVELALSISVDKHLDLLQALLEDGLADGWEVSDNVLEVDCLGIGLLDESDDVRLAALFDEVLEVTGLRVVDF